MAKYITCHRRGTVAQWAEESTIIPFEGEIVIELDEENYLHKLKIGDGIHTYAELAYLRAGDEIITQVLAEAKPRVITVELSATWNLDSEDKYSQTLALDNITEHSRLDLQPSADMLVEFKQLGLVFVTENNAGIITVYSVGNMPQKAYTMQATIVETECDGKDGSVVGIPVGAPAIQAAEGDNKIPRSYQGKWYAVYPSLFASGDTWYKGTTDKTTITEINIFDTYTPTSEETETWNADVDNMGYIKCYISGTVLTIVGNGYGKLACHMNSASMFKNFTALTVINGADLLDTSGVTTMNSMFANSSALTTLDVSNWDTHNVTDMYGVFGNCKSLASLDVSRWNTSKVTTIRAMFQKNEALTTIDVSKWDISNVVNTHNFMYGCTALTTLDISNWDTHNVTDMSGMFAVCPSLAFLDVSRWDVGNVKSMNDMFAVDSAETNTANGKLIVDVSHWNPKSLEQADSMFYGCAEITSLDLRNWDISKLKSMSHMFCRCNKLEEVKLDGLVASSCISFNAMFNNCHSLVSIDLTGFVTAAAEEFQQMFEKCYALTEIKGLDTFVTTNAKAYHEMFYNASSLTELDLSSFITANLTTGIAYGRTGELNRYYPMTNMFTGMNKLQKVTFGDSFEFIEENYLPAPSAEYIEGATGLWKDESTGITYAPADVPINTAATYVAA